MFILTNLAAAGGRARCRWELVLPGLARDSSRISQCDVSEPGARHALHRALASGETDIVAAGGDGTVNSLLNELMRLDEPEIRRRIRLGAIGLGSSNDFHKPLDARACVDDTPLALDFANAVPRDIGSVTVCDGTRTFTRYFLINASIGVAAEANRLFNTPGPVRRWLKRHNTPLAIGIAAALAIATFRPPRLHISGPGTPAMPVDVTNLSILKSPHISGSLRYPVRPGYRSGRFGVVLAARLSRLDTCRFAAALTSPRGDPMAFCTSWSAPSVSVWADAPFALEIDGEVLTARRALFEVVPHALRVCP
jgi:diacylglycerol kinase family enzyme